jgi:small subunit ribosomal protein S20
MANNKATLKDVRQVKKRRERNRYQGKTTRNAIRKVQAIDEHATAVEALPKTIAMIDKLAKNNVIHKNKAANLKSKLTKKVNALKGAEKVTKAKVAKKVATKKPAAKKLNKNSVKK